MDTATDDGTSSGGSPVCGAVEDGDACESASDCASCNCFLYGFPAEPVVGSEWTVQRTVPGL